MRRRRTGSVRPNSRFPPNFSLRRGAARDVLRSLLAETAIGAAELRAAVDEYVAHVHLRAEHQEFVDVRLAEKLAGVARSLLEHTSPDAPDIQARLIQAAIRYFVLHDDAEADLGSVVGWDDDVEVFNAVAAFIARPDLVVEVS